ncbi:MAG: hypothetical protein DME49_02125 [Verrucomicrobia bacterium]|nr:MAG: hypothetical protein DME49_02125 [Verrucomicrobiota bacterium]PYK94666.1 MAG: hypothetical protein DME36_04800 [Verrucomicrobiota bacterium]
MTEAAKNVREYLAEIGKRGGIANRRERTRRRWSLSAKPSALLNELESRGLLAVGGCSSFLDRFLQAS